MLMKKIFLCLFVLFVGGIQLWAASVNEEQARKIAANFARAIPSLRSTGEDVGELTTAYVSLRNDGFNRFYVFNRGKSNGFVIVSGDDRAEAVLGYTDNGSFDINNIPPNMKWWLDEYANQMDALQQTVDFPARITAGAKKLEWVDALVRPQPKRARSGTEVEPLLGNIAWNQDEPFNNLCPTLISGSRAPSGCLATAMAQIMYYHKHPVQGTGSYEYESVNGGMLSVDFGSTRYDWDNMLETYENGYNAMQASAVATLMYHCGVSLNTQYANVSNSHDMFVAGALHDYFGYDGGMSYRQRKYYSDAKWEELIRNELNAGRPITYGGTTATGGGHAFVCDGYDANGYFHINWGWSGRYNGYFLLRALEPSGQGIGGYEGGYNNNQTMVIGIRPDQGGKLQPVMVSDSIYSMDKSIDRTTESLRIIGNVINRDWDAVRVNVGIMICNEAGELVTGIPYLWSVTLEPRTGLAFDESKPFQKDFPAELTDGTYHIYFGFLTEDSSTWERVEMSPYMSNGVKAVVSGNTVTFSNLPPEEDVPEIPTFDLIAFAGQTVVPSTVNSTEDFTITTVLSNRGSALKGKLYVAILAGSIEQTYRVSQFVPFQVDKGQEIPVSFSCNMQGYPDMTYPLEIIAVVEGTAVDGTYFVPMDDNLSMLVDVRGNGGATPSEPKLSIVEAESSIFQKFTQFTNYNMDLTLRNDGLAFQGDVYALLWDGQGTLYHEQAIPVDLPQGQKKNFIYTWNVPASVPIGRCVFSYARLVGDIYHFIPFDDVQGTTGIYVTIEANTDAPELNLVSGKTVIPSVFYQNTDFMASTVLKNSGGADFKGEVCLLVLTTDGNVKYNTKPFLQVDVPANGSVPLNIEGNVGNLALGNYYVAFATVEDLVPTLLYYDTGGNVTNVEVQKSVTSLPDTDDDSEALRIYYSNPVQNLVTIRGSEILERISMYTLAGTKVFEKDSPASNEYSIDMSYWNQGTYLLVVQTKALKRTVKLLKK